MKLSMEKESIDFTFFRLLSQPLAVRAASFGPHSDGRLDNRNVTFGSTIHEADDAPLRRL